LSAKRASLYFKPPPVILFVRPLLSEPISSATRVDEVMSKDQPPTKNSPGTGRVPSEEALVRIPFPE